MPQTTSIASSHPNPVAAQKLVAVARQAYILYPKNCSGSVHYVITQLVDPKIAGIETGPGALVTGLVGGLVGGYAGFTGAEWAARWIEH